MISPTTGTNLQDVSLLLKSCHDLPACQRYSIVQQHLAKKPRRDLGLSGLAHDEGIIKSGVDNVAGDRNQSFM